MDTEYLPATRCCSICGQVLSLEDCKIDEKGLAVHESCYAVKVALEKPSAQRRAIAS